MLLLKKQIARKERRRKNFPKQIELEDNVKEEFQEIENM